jgi:hypothetical protein
MLNEGKKQEGEESFLPFAQSKKWWGVGRVDNNRCL